MASTDCSSITLGTYGPLGFKRRFTLHGAQINTHLHAIGVSGSGKSRFLASYFLQLLEAGHAGALIDPHGDLAHLCLDHLIQQGRYKNPHMFDSIIFLDIPEADRRGRYLPFNVLGGSEKPSVIAENMVEACKRAWSSLADGAAPLFENVMLHAVVVLVANHRPLTDLPRLLTDRPFRERMLRSVTDSAIVRFFHDRYDQWGRDQPQMIESTLRRASLLTFSDPLRYSLGQTDSMLPFRQLMDQGISVIIDLGGLTEATQKLLGCLITVGFEMASLSRADMPEPQRRPFHLLLDEFSMFSAQSADALSRMLSLTRKYGLYLHMAHQTWSQTSERLKGALQNVGLEVAFRLGRSDAEHSALQLGRVDLTQIKHEVADEHALERTHPVFAPLNEQWEAWVQALQDLKPRQAYVKQPTQKLPIWQRLLHRHALPHAIKITTVPVPDAVIDPAEKARVRDEYLRRYFHPITDLAAPPAPPMLVRRRALVRPQRSHDLYEVDTHGERRAR